MGRCEEPMATRCLREALLTLEIVDRADGVEVRNHGGLLSEGGANWPADTIGRAPRSNSGEIAGFFRLLYGTFEPRTIAPRHDESAHNVRTCAWNRLD